MNHHPALSFLAALALFGCGGADVPNATSNPKHTIPQQIDEGGYVLKNGGTTIGWAFAFKYGDKMVEYWARGASWPSSQTELTITEGTIPGAPSCRAWHDALCQDPSSADAAYYRTEVTYGGSHLGCGGLPPVTRGEQNFLWPGVYAMRDARSSNFAWIFVENGVEQWAMTEMLGPGLLPSNVVTEPPVSFTKWLEDRCAGGAHPTWFTVTYTPSPHFCRRTPADCQSHLPPIAGGRERLLNR